MYTDALNAFNGVLCFIKVFKHTRSNKRLAQFTDTLAVAYRDMVVLTVVIALMCVGFGLAFTLAFGSYFAEYRNVVESLLSLFESVSECTGFLLLYFVPDRHRQIAAGATSSAAIKQTALLMPCPSMAPVIAALHSSRDYKQGHSGIFRNVTLKFTHTKVLL